MNKEHLISDLMNDHWYKVGGDSNRGDLAEEAAKADVYRARAVRQLDALISVTDGLCTLSNTGIMPEVATTVLMRLHRTHQADVVRAAFKVIAAMATVDLGTDARNEDAINLCKDVMAGFGERIGFARI